MILSVSRRTDIPAFYLEWFLNRLDAGYLLVRNPYNARQLSKILLTPELVDGIVFWSKNPQPLLTYLPRLRAYPFYVQFTLNAYAKDIETVLPVKSLLIRTFQELAAQIGPERLVWRYDPVLINASYTAEYHLHYFAELARHLSGCTQQVTFSFLDFYAKISQSIQALGIVDPPQEEKKRLAAGFAAIAAAHGMRISACAEQLDLRQYGVERASCVDVGLLEQIGGWPLQVEKDKNQRPACGCAAAIDVGAYDTCLHGCRYCYANYRREVVLRQSRQHDQASPLLCGQVTAEDKITLRQVESARIMLS